MHNIKLLALLSIWWFKTYH